MKRRGTSDALVLGVVHAAVDAACAFVLFRDVDTAATPLHLAIAWIVSYDALAFLLQVPIGIWADRRRDDRVLAGLGLAFVLVALGLGPPVPGPAALVAALGNACYHVGAGASVLRRSAQRSAAIGLFVGPGATGLCAGIVLGRGSAPLRAALALALVVGAGLVVRCIPRVSEVTSAIPVGDGTRALGPGPGRAWLFGSALLLLTVSTRSIAGDNVTSLWRGAAPPLVLGLALAASAGKMLGGVAGDRLGWSRTAGVSLALAGPLLALGLGDPLAASVGLLLLSATTAVTLKALHLAIPDRPGLAFGLPSAALVLAAAPGLFSVWPLRGGALVCGAVWLSAAAVVAGLALAAPGPWQDGSTR